jgi:hypothetical protein
MRPFGRRGGQNPLERAVAIVDRRDRITATVPQPSLLKRETTSAATGQSAPVAIVNTKGRISDRHLWRTHNQSWHAPTA